MRFYIDECGHTGDAVNSGTDLDFAGQPYFVLASVGITDQGNLERELMALRKRHGIGMVNSSLLSICIKKLS